MPIAHVAGVLSAGNISHDILVRPVNEFRWGTSTWVEEFVEDMGGNASNTAYALARLGVPVKVMGMVGRDERGEGVLRKLTGVGVDVSAVARSEGPTTTTICVVPALLVVGAKKLLRRFQIEKADRARIRRGGAGVGILSFRHEPVSSAAALRRPGW